MPSLTAAASVQGRPGAIPPTHGPARIWQEQAWAYFHALGVVKYSAYFYGKALSRVRLLPGVMNEEGEIEAAFDDEGAPRTDADVDPAIAAEIAGYIAQLRSPIGGQPAIMRSFGINLFVAGECNLTGIPKQGDAEEWEVFSTDELRAVGIGKDNQPAYERVGGPGERPERLPDGSFVCRVWQPDERFKRMADSSLRGVLDTCEELVLLTREVRAEALSRIPNGILAISDQITYSGNLNTQDGTTVDDGGDIPPDDEEEDEFTIDLIEAMMTAIKDKSSAAAVVPIVVRGPTDAIERGLKHLLLARPESQRAILKRREAVEMYAMGIDLPVEVVLGHQQTTFSNAFQVDEDTYKVHVLPKLEVVVDALTSGYIHTKMRAARNLDPGQPLPAELVRYCVNWDATKLVSHPDRSKEATEGHKLFIINDAAWRRANGFTEADAPDEEELGRRINMERLRNVRETIRETVTLEGTPVEALSTGDIAKALAASGAPTTIDPAMVVALQIAGAAEVSIDKAVERLGRRLRTAARKNSHGALVEGVPNADVAVTLGPAVCSALLGSEALFPGEFTSLAKKAFMWGESAGVTEPAELAARVIAVAEVVAERRLYGDNRVGPEQFIALLGEARLMPADLIAAGRG